MRRLVQNRFMPRSAKKTETPVRSAPKRTRAHAAAKPSLASGEPLYRQLVQSLRADILKGVFPVGSQLPTEELLAEKFAVSRHTVREALRQLRADLLVSSRQGSGTTVMPPPHNAPFNVHRVTSIDELIAYAAESRYIVDRTGVVRSEDPDSLHAELPGKRNWLRLQGFRVGEEPIAPPICWTEVFVAAEYAGVERMMGRQRGPIWRLIEDLYGERLVEIEQMLRVRPVPPEIADGLQVDPTSTVVEVRRTYKTSADKVAEVSVNLYPADTFRFNMRLRRS